MNEIKALIIDDDDKLRSLLSDYLPKYGIRPVTASDGKSGLESFASENPDIVILDILMPGMDGFEVLRELRKSGAAPVIMLSARGEATDKIIGLELGADDYMAKPFNPRELVSRITSIMRRISDAAKPVEHKEAEPAAIDIGALHIDVIKREAHLDAVVLELTTMEYETLALLAANPGRKFSRDEIAAEVKGFGQTGFSRSIDIMISRLRAKLGESARKPRFIKSVHGYGYVFLGDGK